MHGNWYSLRGDDLVLKVRVQPRASREGIDGLHGDRLRIRIGAPPVDDAANARLIELLARVLDVPKSALSLARGAHGRDKEVRIEGGAGRHRELAARLVASGT